MFPRIKSIEIKQDNQPLSLADRRQDTWAMLHSGKTGFGHRYSIVGENPYLIIEGHGAHESRLCTFLGYQEISQNSWVLLQSVMDRYRDVALTNSAVPFLAGTIIAMSYDLFNSIDKKPETNSSGQESLLVCFFKDYAVYDHLDGKHWAVHVHGPKPISQDDLNYKTPSADQALSGISADAYIAGVKKIKSYIRDGRIYQVNYAQQFCRKTALSPFEIFNKLNSQNPAPMSGFLKINKRALISSSPERFLSRRGGVLESNPIKGTRPRFHNLERDKGMVRELWNSPKENAELAMIVDLMRNDLGRHAQVGSVCVKTARRIENYNNVFHLVAKVGARVDKNLDALKIIRDAYPPGSITGCPKLESMHVIVEMEEQPRGFYTGAMGYLDFNGNFDLNVMIRSLYYRNGWVKFGLGSGIVYDSIPQAEYDETLEKGQTIFEILK